MCMWICTFGEKYFDTDGAVLKFTCQQVVVADKNFQVIQHIKSPKHKAAIDRQDNERQLFLTSSFENQGKLSEFYLDLHNQMNSNSRFIQPMGNVNFHNFFRELHRSKHTTWFYFSKTIPYFLMFGYFVYIVLFLPSAPKNPSHSQNLANSLISDLVMASVCPRVVFLSPKMRQC